MNAVEHGMLSWVGHLNGALWIWVLPKACSVSLGRSFNQDVLHGVAKCMLFILASDFLSAEHFQLQLLLVGCEPRQSHAELGAVKPAVSDWARRDLTALSGSLLMVRLRILDPIPGPGKPAALLGANHSARSPASHPCSSSVFSYPVYFAWLIPVPPIWVHFLRFSPLLCSASSFPHLYCCSVPPSSPSPSDLSKCPLLSLWLQFIQDPGPSLLSSMPAWLNLFLLWS